MDSNDIYYFEFQTWNMALQPAYNICTIAIQLYNVPTLNHKSLCPELLLM